MRIETGREIVILPGNAEQIGVPQAWRVGAVAKREGRNPLPRDLGKVPVQPRMRGRLVDILV